MNRWKQWLAWLIFTALFLSSCNTSDGGGLKLPVVLIENENITILSENPVAVTSGGDAVFQVEVTPGFTVRESESYTYTDGYITVKNVLYPTSVTVGLDFNFESWINADPAKIPRDREFSYTALSDKPDYGSVTSSLASVSDSAGQGVHLLLPL